MVQEEETPVCSCRLTKPNQPGFMSGNHEAYCQVSMRDRGLPWQPLNVFEWDCENARLRAEEERLLAEIRRIRDNHKFRCTHKNAAGEDVRQAVGGGETFCYTCRQQFD